MKRRVSSIAIPAAAALDDELRPWTHEVAAWDVGAPRSYPDTPDARTGGSGHPRATAGAVSAADPTWAELGLPEPPDPPSVPPDESDEPTGRFVRGPDLAGVYLERPGRTDRARPLDDWHLELDRGES